MMPHYHIGTLDDAAKRILSDGELQPEPTTTEPRPVFLDPRAWTRATLHSKKTVSWDTRIFTFKLEHEDQLLGLPTGQHLMLRLRDPVTREAIIRAYTPISETGRRGFVDVLVKLYLDTKERKGGKMTTALDALPLGHPVDAKGPVGKFEYLGRGLCRVNGTAERRVRRFVMICGGSGITPIFQVLRAVMLDKDDRTACTVLDGNRLVEDILCKADLDAFAAMSGSEEKCRLVYTLTQAPEGEGAWTGRRGRIAGPLLEEYAPAPVRGEEGEGEGEAGDSLVLLCGPEALEKSAHRALNEIGWRDEDLLFF